jgi:hypothetical protein
VGCNESRKSDANESAMAETVIVPRANPYEPFAISTDGSLVVHTPTGIIQSERVYESIVDVQDVKSSSQVATFRLPVQPNTGFQFKDIEFCDDGRYLVAIGPVAAIYPGQDPASIAGDLITSLSEDFIKILDMKSMSLHADISLSAAEHSYPPEALAKYRQFNKEWHGWVSFAACAANAPIAVIVIDYGNNMGAVKIFNLETGIEVPGFEGIPIQKEVLGLAVSPQGSSLALFRSENMPGGNDENAPDHCITVVDLQDKKTRRTIWVKSDTPSNANPIAYAGESTVAAELSTMEMIQQTGFGVSHDPPSFRYPTSVHIFDIVSGSEVRVISDPDADDFSLQEISADGRTMLAYAGRSHQCKSCNHGQGQRVISDAHFTLWNPMTGKLIARSPELKIVHHTCPWLSLHDLIWRSCVSSDEAPILKFSQNGNAVAASWVFGGEPIEVYSLPSH